MRRLGATLFAVVCLAAPVLAVSLCEYRSAESSIADSRLSFAYRYYDDAATPDVDVNSGRLAATFDSVTDSPNVGLSLAASCEFALSGFVPTAWLGHGTATARLYPWSEGDVFLFGGAEVAAATELVQPGLEARAGLGLGRVTDVTPLAKAVQIDGALVDLGVLPNGLADDVLLAVAKLVGRAPEYPSSAELVSDIEAVVEFDAGIPLDARALLAIEELVLASGSQRRCGWVVQAGVGYELLDPYGGAQSAVFAASCDAALASGPEGQLLLHASFSGPFSALDENSFFGSSSYELNFGKGQSLTAGYNLSRLKPSGKSATTTHEASLELTFSAARGSLGLQVSVSRTSGDPGWSIDVSMSAAVDLL